MREEPKPKVKDQDPTAWGNFWEAQFDSLKLNRLILQKEKLTKTEKLTLTGLMIEECKKPPYDQIEKSVIQGVIVDAVLNDPDFIGFSVSWIRRTLNKWWHLQGWMKLEKIQREKEEEAERLALQKRLEDEKNNTSPEVSLTNPHEDVHQTVRNYVNRLLAEARESKGGPQAVPKMSLKEIQKEGKEWTSGIEQKATGTPSSRISIDQYNMSVILDEVKGRVFANVQVFDRYAVYIIKDHKIFASSEQQAREIYEEAAMIFQDLKNKGEI